MVEKKTSQSNLSAVPTLPPEEDPPEDRPSATADPRSPNPAQPSWNIDDLWERPA